jgi:hypothetical protein
LVGDREEVTVAVDSGRKRGRAPESRAESLKYFFLVQ